MISVVIPAFNEEAYIGLTLETLAQQKTTQEFEVLVVDNASVDRTPEIVNSFSSRLKIKLIKENRRGRGQARATGFAKAKGEIILSTDADVLVPPDWIEKMSEPFNNPKVAGVATMLITYDLSPFDNWLYGVCDWGYMWFNRIFFGNHTVVGCSFGVRKSVYEAVGGFHIDLRAEEDVELGWKLRKAGKVVLIPGLRPKISGRRFRRGVIIGFLEYAWVLFKIVVLRQVETDLKHVR
jgi:glycosyltransferase involved in cell wall biosynthesis